MSCDKKRCCDTGIYLNPTHCEETQFNWKLICDFMKKNQEPVVVNELWDGSQTEYVLPAVADGEYSNIEFHHEGIEFSLVGDGIDLSEAGSKGYTQTINADGSISLKPMIALGSADYKCRITIKYNLTVTCS